MEQEKNIQEQLKKLTKDDTTENDRLSAELKTIWQKMEYIEADKAESRASVILAGLGFSAEEQLQPTSSFSGGWRMRISLARGLFCKPDILLLDEPTNHVDLNGCAWLESYLSNWNQTLLVVSHNRDFLDAVSSDIIHMHSLRLD